MTTDPRLGSAQAVLDEWATDDPTQRCGEPIGTTGRCDLRRGHPPIAEAMGWMHIETLAPLPTETPDAPAPAETPRYDVAHGYLIEHVGGCTCVGGGVWPHEEYCGWEPLGPVEELLAQIERLRTELAAAEQRGAERELRAAADDFRLAGLHVHWRDEVREWLRARATGSTKLDATPDPGGDSAP